MYVVYQGDGDGKADSGSRSRYMMGDIARGMENHPIPVVACDHPFPAFRYINTSVVYKAAIIDQPISKLAEGVYCRCSGGDCLRYPWCDCCADGKPWKFAYTSGGILRDAFMRARLAEAAGVQKGCECVDLQHLGGHEPCPRVQPVFITECNAMCGCHSSCGNRVVQQGMKYKVEVFHTDRTRWGVRAADRIPKGAFVFEMTGEILTNAEAIVRNSEAFEGEPDYSVQIDADWNLEQQADDNTALTVDAREYGNVARFLNHR